MTKVFYLCVDHAKGCEDAVTMPDADQTESCCATGSYREYPGASQQTWLCDGLVTHYVIGDDCFEGDD